MFERTCLCGRTTTFRDELALKEHFCLYCGNSLERQAPPDVPLAVPDEPELPSRPAGIYVVQALILIYLILSAFLWRGVLENVKENLAMQAATAGAFATTIVWIVMFLGLRWRAKWGWSLSVGVFSLLILTGAVIGARIALFNLRGEFLPGNVSVHGSSCAMLFLIIFSASFGFPLWLLVQSRARY